MFGRLVVVQVAVAVLLAALLPLLISVLLTSTTNAFVGRELDRSATRLRPSIAYAAGSWRFTAPLSPMFAARGGMRNARVVDAAGRTQLEQGPNYAIPLRILPLGATHEHRLWNGIDVASYPIASNGHHAWLVISSDRRRPESLVANVATTFLHRFLWIVPALVFCSLMLTLLFVAQGTRAIRRVSRRAGDIDGNSLDVRLDARALPLEVQPLADAVNQALTRVQESYAEQTEFAGNVAHELRNPLATIACRIEEIADPHLRARMSVSVAHAAHVVDQLMMLARLGGQAPSLSPVDLRSVIIESLEQSASRVVANGRTLEFEDRALGLELPVEANEALTRMSVENLIDNADRHTPPGTHIRVTLDRRSRVFVEDNGPGIARAEHEKARLRHWRASDRVADGAGLGLSIVSRAMAAQNGSLEICESSAGAKLALVFSPVPDAVGAPI